MLKNVVKTMGSNSETALEQCKSRLMDNVINQLQGCNVRSVTFEEQTSIIKEAKQLCEQKYGNDNWVYRTDVKYRDDVRFCILFEGPDAKPTGKFRPVLEKPASEMFDGAEIVLLTYGAYDAAMNLAINAVLRERSDKDGIFYIRFFDFERPSIILAENDHPNQIKDRNLEGVDISRSDGGGRPMIVSKNGLGYCVTGPLHGPLADRFDNVIKIHDNIGSIIARAIRSIVGASYEFGLGKTGSSIRVGNDPIAGHSARINGRHSFSYAGYVEVRAEDPDLIRSAVKVTDEDMERIEKLPTIMGLSKA